MPAEPVIRARGLTKRYGDTLAVDHLDLEVSRGEVFGLLGPNGAGKTTTILMLLGLTEPTEGAVRVLGLDPARDPLGVKRRVGYLPDSVGFYEGLTGRENLRYTARLNRMDPEVAEERIDTLLEQVGLTDAADRPAGTYSRGMIQRLGIADALVKDPEVLILDEPTASIDPEGVSEMLALIRTLATEQGVTQLLSSHHLRQVQEVCDRVAIFVSGRILAAGTTHELALTGSGPERLEVRIDGSRDALTEALHSVAGVHEVRPGRRPGVWEVVVDREAAGDAIQAIATSGVELLELHRASEELDEIYHRYFQEVNSHAG